MTKTMTALRSITNNDPDFIGIIDVTLYTLHMTLVNSAFVSVNDTWAPVKHDMLPDTFKRTFLAGCNARVKRWEEKFDVYAYVGATGLRNEFKRAVQIVFWTLREETQESLTALELGPRWANMLRTEHQLDSQFRKTICGVCSKSHAMPLCRHHEDIHDRLFMHRTRPAQTYKSSMQMVFAYEQHMKDGGTFDSFIAMSAERKRLWERDPLPPKPAPQVVPTIPREDVFPRTTKPMTSHETRRMNYELRQIIAGDLFRASLSREAAHEYVTGIPSYPRPAYGLTAQQTRLAVRGALEAHGAYPLLGRLICEGESPELRTEFQNLINICTENMAAIDFVQQGGGGISGFFKNLITSLQRVLPKNAGLVAAIVVGSTVCAIGAYFFIRSNKASWNKVLFALGLVPVLFSTVWAGCTLIDEIITVFRRIDALDTTLRQMTKPRYERSSSPDIRDDSLLYAENPAMGYRQQGGEDEEASIGSILEKVATRFATVVAGEQGKFRPGPSVFSVLHTAATAVHDVSTLANLIGPVAEAIVGGIYEAVTGDPWVPWAERKIHQQVIPLIDRGAEYARTWQTPARIHNVAAFRQEVEKFLVEVEAMEKQLVLGRANVRYTAPLATLRQTTNMLLKETKAANANQGVRTEPVGFVVFGAAGVGKSTCMDYFHRVLAPTFHQLRPDLYQPEFDSRIVYPRTGTSQYWEGVGTPAIVTYPDAYRTVDQEQRAVTTAELLQLISCDPFTPDMAFEGKGSTFIEPLMVTVTRNGGAKLINTGAVDPLTVPRRFHMSVKKKHGGSARNPSSWVFERYDIHGKSMGPITTEEIVVELRAMLLWNNRKMKMEFEMPVLKDLTEDELLTRGEEAAARHRQQLLTTPQIGNAKSFRQQGNVGSRKSDLETVKNHYYSMLEIIARVDTGVELKADLEFLHTEANRILGRATTTVAEAAETVFADVKRKVVNFFAGATDFSASQWDRVSKWVKESQDDFIRTAAWAYMRRAMSSAYDRITTWVQHNPLAVVVSALTVVGTVVALVAGAFTLRAILSGDAEAETTDGEVGETKPAAVETKDDEGRDGFVQQYKVKQSKPTARSRAWKEDHFGDSIQGGRYQKGGKTRAEPSRGGDGMHNKAGKLLPTRMRDPIYRQQVKSFELPLLSALLHNIYQVTYVDRDGFVRTGQITMTHNRFAVTCKHVGKRLMTATKIVLKQCYVDPNGKAVSIVKEVRTPRRLIALEDKEDAFIEFDKDLDMARDIRHLFITDQDLETTLDVPVRDVRVLWRDERGERLITEAPYAECNFMEVGYNIDNEMPGAQVDKETFYLTYPLQTPDGSSGALVVSMEAGRVHRILGIHTGSNAAVGTGVAVTQELVHASTDDAPSIEHVPSIKMEDPDHQHVPISSGVPLGKVAFKQQGSSKNKLQPSLLAIHLREDPKYPIKTMNLPTVMFPMSPQMVAKKWEDRGVIPHQADLSLDVIDPWEKGSKSPPFKSVNTAALEEVWDDRWLPPFPGDVYHILTPEQAMFGYPPLGVESVDMSSSPGYNLGGTQPYDRWILVGSDRFKREQKPFAEWHPDLRGAILEIYECFKRGNYNTGLVVDSLKAELRGIPRVLGVETRIYYATSLAVLIVAKQFCEALTTAEKRVPTLSTPMVGINPCSPEWKELWMELRKFANHMCLDSANFDQHSQQSIVVTVGELTLKTLENLGIVFRFTDPAFWRGVGFEPDNALARHGIMAGFVSTGSSVHVRGSWAYYDAQVMSSGQYRTTAVGSYRLRCTVGAAILDALRLKGEQITMSPRDYLAKHLVTKTYGDDMISGLATDLNVTTYEFAQSYQNLFGGRLTTADKGPILPDTPFTPLEDIVILKRRFVPFEGVVLAPLEKKSIEQSLMWTEGRSHAMETCAQTIQSALLEAAMHGREYYDTLYGAVQRAATKAKVPFHPPSYDHVMEMVRKA